MKGRKRIIIWSCLLAVILYLFLPLPFITHTQELAIQKQAFCHLYDSGHYGRKEELNTCYIQIGEGKLFDGFESRDNNNTELRLTEPSDQLLEAMSDFPIKICSGFLCNESDSDSESTDSDRPRDRKVLFGVGPILKSLGLARCRTFYDGGCLCAAEYESFFVWTPFGWKHLFSFMLWVS